jgi:WD40 repeat protein
VLGVAAAGTVAACAFVIGVLVHKGLAEAGLWAAVVGGLAGVLGAAAAVWAVVPRSPQVPLPPELRLEDWVVGRPAELAAVVRALAGERAETVGITTGLYGAGGFGKTTLARMVCADRQIRRRFGGRVYLVTVGRDVRGPAAVAAKVNEVIKHVFDVDAAFADPQLAGARLGSLLDAGPRRLLVLDDVWEAGQLAPFIMGGKKCARLVTTRVPELLAGRGTAVQVDQMTGEQARALLTAGLPPLDEAAAAGLLSVTGRWPLLLRLVNKILADYAQVADTAAVPAQATVLLGQLAAGGPEIVDDFREDRGRGLDVGQPDQRALAVRATIGASTGLLSDQDAERFAELGIFVEDETIPFRLVAAWWQATAELDELRAAQVCRRLAQLALISQAAGPDGGIALHDVIRDFLRARLSQQQRLAGLNGAFLDAVAAGLPAVSPLNDAADCPVSVAWWELGSQDQYLWDHLIEHLRDARRSGDAEAVACDLRWAGARLERFGPAAPAADLAAAGTSRAARLRGVLERTAHLLAPTDPAGAVVDVLYSRVADDPDWGLQVTALASTRRRPRLVNHWPLPDLADPALRRVLEGHADPVMAVAVAPDGSWLATASWDGTARIWDAATGRQRAILEGHADPVTGVAVAPDGSWLATASWDGTARIWDAATGRQRAVLKGHTGRVMSVAVAPDGSWLATASDDGTVRVWDAATGRQRAVLHGHNNPVTLAVVVVAPDGSWLATANDEGTVRVWDAATGHERAVLHGHTSPVTVVMAVTAAVAPDGGWLATASKDRTVRVWDAATGHERPVLMGHTGLVTSVAVAPDGSWLAAASDDGTVRVWDAATGHERAVLHGHTGPVMAVAVAPDGSWLATAGWDRTARVWDAATGHEGAVLIGHTGPVAVTAMAVAPDGSWLATASNDRTARVWDAATGHQRAVLQGHTGRVAAMAVAPDGSWLATASDDRTARVWHVATGHQRPVLHGHTGPVTAMAVAPRGNWLATASDDGTARVWHVGTGHQRAVLQGHTGRVAAMAVAPDGSWLATASDDETARVWHVATGHQRAVLHGHTGPVTAMAVAPDGSWLATASDDETARVWHVATGHQRPVLHGHTDLVTAMAVALDGSWLATASDDGTARVWDPATGHQRAVLIGHTGPVTAMAVAPDGSWLATASDDGTARIWDPATGHSKTLMRVDGSIAVCSWLGSNALAIGGSAGLHLFRFLTETSLVAG